MFDCVGFGIYILDKYNVITFKVSDGYIKHDQSHVLALN